MGSGRPQHPPDGGGGDALFGQQLRAPADQQIPGVGIDVPVLGKAAARAAGQRSLAAWGLLDASTRNDAKPAPGEPGMRSGGRDEAGASGDEKRGRHWRPASMGCCASLRSLLADKQHDQGANGGDDDARQVKPATVPIPSRC